LERKLKAKDGLIDRMQQQRGATVSEELQQVLSYVDSVLKKSNHKSIESLQDDYVKAVDSSKLNESKMQELRRRLRDKETLVNKLEQQKKAGTEELEEVLAYIDSILNHSNHGSLHTLLEDYIKATEFCKISESKIQELEAKLHELECKLQEKEDSSTTSELLSTGSADFCRTIAIGFVAAPPPKQVSDSIKERRLSLRHQEKKLRKDLERIGRLERQSGLHSASLSGPATVPGGLDSAVHQLEVKTLNLQRQLNEAKMSIQTARASKDEAEARARQTQIELERTVVWLQESEESREKSIARTLELEAHLDAANSKLSEAAEVYSEYLNTVADLDTERESLNSQLLQVNEQLQQLKAEEFKLLSQLEETNSSIECLNTEKQKAVEWAGDLQEALEAAVLELQEAEISRDQNKDRNAELEAQVHQLSLELAEKARPNPQYQANSVNREKTIENGSVELREANAILRRREASQAAEISNLRAELSSVQLKLRESQEHRDEIQDRIFELSTEISEARTGLAEKEQINSKSKEYIEKLESELEQVFLDLQEVNTTLQDKESTESDVISGLRLDLSNCETKKEEACDKIDELENEIRQLEKRAEEVKSSNDALEHLLEERGQENNKLEFEIGDLRRLLTQARGQVEDLEDERNYSRAKLSELSRILEVRGETDAEKHLYTKSMQLAETSAELNDAQNKLRQSEAKIQKLEQEIQLLRGVAHEMDEAKLENDNNSLGIASKMSVPLAESRPRAKELSEMLRQSSSQPDSENSSNVHSTGIRVDNRVDEGSILENSQHGNRSRSSETTESCKFQSIDQTESTLNVSSSQVQRMMQRIALLEEENSAYATSLCEVKAQLDARGEDSTER